jgi:hypothetical protein
VTYDVILLPSSADLSIQRCFETNNHVAAHADQEGLDFFQAEAIRGATAGSQNCTCLQNPSTPPGSLNTTTLMPHSIIHGDVCFAYSTKSVACVLLSSLAR